MLPHTPFTRVPREQLNPQMQQFWDGSMKLHGDTTFFEVMGNAPEATDWYMNDFYGKLYKSGRLDPQIVELVRLRLANVHGCAFCNRADRIAALASGVSEEQVDSLADYENGPFSEREKAALALADVMVLTNEKGAVSRELYARLKRSFTDGELVELGMIMAVLAGMAKFIFAYDLVEKEDYCPFMPKAAA